MSGIEIAGLVFGVVPIVVEILRSYGTAKRRLATFSRHAEVAYDIQLKFEVAAANFSNECRLLLQSTIAYPSDVSEMMEDPTHQSWQEQGKEIEQRLQNLMQQDYQLCQDIVTRLRDILRETRNSLSKLENGLGNAKQSQHEFARKLWNAFNTARKENEYLQQLDSLDRWNKSLGKLCKQRRKMQKRRNVHSACIIRKAVPRSYQQIRVASQQLGESIHDSWSCTNTSHSGHQAKLSLDAKSEHDNVQLDVVIACQPKPNTAIQSLSTDVPIWLQIRSITSLAICRILQKITLAQKLAEAVLQYHSTSWLPQAWTLQDVAYFTSPSHADASNMTNALDSLHLSNRFPDHAPPNTESQQNMLDLKHNFGIRNLTLAKLGVALLDICGQSVIMAPGLDGTPQPRDIIQARKLLDEQHHSIMTLGPRYLEVVRKCLYCDFSCNDDLHGEALQSAVYTEVVCTLEDMETQWKRVFGL
ncbi:hypothetical protein J4E81_001775 [Alternaria sp. BMP 2799]|nr:hypothetical protein J4E81_001775 [Alternaria sp. BMP 2799]